MIKIKIFCKIQITENLWSGYSLYNFNKIWNSHKSYDRENFKRKRKVLNPNDITKILKDENMKSLVRKHLTSPNGTIKVFFHHSPRYPFLYLKNITWKTYKILSKWPTTGPTRWGCYPFIMCTCVPSIGISSELEGTQVTVMNINVGGDPEWTPVIIIIIISVPKGSRQ